MPENNSSTVKIIDKAIFVFIIIFLLSISNSIFVNQIGYYGALILILVKAAVTKKNQFSKTGLELAIVWYIIAEIISTIFSHEKPLSVNNALKHILLIPLIYTTLAAVKDFKTAKTVLKIYLGGTLVTVLIYLYFSFQFYIKNLYGITESGPSLFQYPITASEIISFTVIFLFAFLVNEKTSLKNKILLFIGFAISALALFSTYKRTGWMGAAFGILLILIITKRWKILAAGFVLFVIFFLTQKNISEVNTFLIVNDSLKPLQIIRTAGSAYDVFPVDDDIVVSDYNKGLKVYKDSTVTEQFEFNSAPVRFFKWKENFYLCNLIDTRYNTFQFVDDKFKKINEFYSVGFTYSDAVANGYFYVLDKDSGLTIFKNPENPKDSIRVKSLINYTSIFVDSSYLIIANPEGDVKVFKLNNALPEKNTFITDSSKFSFISYLNHYIFTINANGLKIAQLDSTGIHNIQDLNEIKSADRILFNDNRYFISSGNGNIYVISENPEGKFSIDKKLNLGFAPRSFDVKSDTLFTTRVENKQNRLLQTFDPYNPSNVTRISLWRAGIKIFLNHPFFGVGDIDLAKLYKHYKEPYHKEIQGHLHNNFFHVLATLGLFGLLAVLFLFYKIIEIDIKVLKSAKGLPYISSYALGTLAAFCGFIISGLTELNFWDHEIATLIWFTFGLNLAFYRSIKPEEKNQLD